MLEEIAINAEAEHMEVIYLLSINTKNTGELLKFTIK